MEDVNDGGIDTVLAHSPDEDEDDNKQPSRAIANVTHQTRPKGAIDRALYLQATGEDSGP